MMKSQVASRCVRVAKRAAELITDTCCQQHGLYGGYVFPGMPDMGPHLTSRVATVLHTLLDAWLCRPDALWPKDLMLSLD
jgi:hypothetical protein